ncbi:hypothetical protein O6H91_02G084700 [Diphasiastrum complanatum]|uniref:Uncharacterized protein n=3 Tax=Diphasiastrum complanatum TaxID=34168 RepID=A0ACC2EHP8_DIPCM|nr:hypothetical protein O6H91_02G084700 [Diphasiastrum complanatum]KAJ7566013.1 hypothetical protein O6H91_02G084700 [Diphasiastrum complanatum]KAJ7566014.1 hypothetical protein O6H91_02G084700 [Diphasiastrum complanatum]
MYNIARSDMEQTEDYSSFFMNLALDEARKALAKLEVPVGCVIVENGEVIASASNRTNETRNATRHAEMEAIDMVLLRWQSSDDTGMVSTHENVVHRFSKCEIYVTCEPCIMCAAGLSILGIKKVYFGCKNERFGGCGSVMSLHVDGCGPCGSYSEKSQSTGSVESSGYECVGGLMAEEAIELFKSFYERGNPNAPRPHRPVQVRN